jgi:hypothetical protein
VFCMVMVETRFCQTARGKVMTIALTDRKFSSHFFLYSSKNRSSQRDCSVTHTHTHTHTHTKNKRNERCREERERKTFPYDDTAMERRIWFLLHLFFSSSGGFAFRHLTRSLRKGIRSICGFPSFVYVYVCAWCGCVCVCVVISSSLFYEYMNIFNGHLSQGRFPDDKFPGKGMIHSPAVRGYFQPCFLCILSPRKIRTTASVFDYGYFKTKFIFLPPKA